MISLIYIITFYINSWLEISNNIHIFQLNYYKIPVQIKWYGKNIKKYGIKFFIYLLILVLQLSLGEIGKIISTLILVINTYLLIPKNVKIPLVYTNRVKILIGTIYIIILSLIALTKSDIIFVIILALMPIVMLIAELLNKPINIWNKNRYVKKAKTKLQGMKDLIVIGVTGSYGKTSVKNFLYNILSEKYNVLMTPLNYNTTLGVCRTILDELKPIHNIFICEMGATKQKDIKEICDIVKPKYGIITSIGEQHLESFKSVENIIKTKFELADSIPQDGIVFLNYDNEHIKNKKTNKKVISYGVTNSKVDYYAYNINASIDGLKFKVSKDNLEISTHILGENNIVNILGCIAIAKELKVPDNEIKYAIKNLKQVEHRLELKKITEKYYIIDDAYNSNPKGAKAALDTLKMFEATKILITPGMIELGEKQYECNYEFGKQAAKVCDYIILVGEKQTKPIYEGIISEKFNNENIFIVEDIKDAFEISKNIECESKIALIENDLPDNY